MEIITQLQIDEIRGIIISLKRKIVVKNVASVSCVKQMPINLPTVEVQKEYEAYYQLVNKSKVAVQKTLDEAQLLFDSLMKEYFG